MREIVQGSTDYRIFKNYEKADYILYRELETDDDIQVPVTLRHEFEQNHIVIFPNTSLTERYYYNLKEQFISNCVLYGPKEAVAKILELKK